MYKRVIAIIIVCTIVVSFSAYSEESNVHVNIPNFDVILNGVKVDSFYRSYPLIEYKNITYFPMTWYDSRFLGIETVWDSIAGLEINKANITGSFNNYKTSKKNESYLLAKIPSFQLKVNGKSIDNASEAYPILICRDVTYFPLTWEYAHKAFGWDYSWSDERGLEINSDNLRVNELNLPEWTKDNDLVKHNGSYYTVDSREDTAKIIKFSPEEPSQYQVLTTFDFENYTDIKPRFHFYIEEKNLRFMFHTGGAVMGSNHYYQINGNDEIIEMSHGYGEAKAWSKGLFRVDYYLPPGQGNLSTYTDGVWSSMVESDFMYGWNLQLDENERLTKGELNILDDKAYMLGTYNYYDQHGRLINRLLSVDCETYETQIILDENIADFKIHDNQVIYRIYDDNRIYSCDLDGNNKQMIAEVDDVDAQIELIEEDGTLLVLVKIESVGRNSLFLVDHEGVSKVVEGDFNFEGILNGLVVVTPNHNDYGFEIINLVTRESYIIGDNITDSIQLVDNVLLVKTVENERYIELDLTKLIH